MMHPDTKLQFINEQIGNGIVATRPIPRGTIVWANCRLDQQFSSHEYSLLLDCYADRLDRFTYRDFQGNYVLCWDIARYENHSCQPNTLSINAGTDLAVRDIAVGEQLTCDYGMLFLKEPMRCYCGTSHCRGMVRSDDIARYGRLWQAAAQQSIPLIDKVEQPLWPFVKQPDEIARFVSGEECPGIYAPEAYGSFLRELGDGHATV